MSDIAARKDALLIDAARMLTGNAGKAHICGDRPFDFQRWPGSGQFTRRVASSTVGIIKILPGLDAVRALAAYQKADCAFLFQLLREVGWSVPAGQIPEVNLTSDGALTFTIPFPEELQSNDVPLGGLTGLQSIWRQGRFVVGPDTSNDLMTPNLLKHPHDVPRHILVGGVTRSGKTWFMRSLLYQLIMMALLEPQPEKRPLIIDLDGKGGDGIGFMRNFPQQIGPTVIDDLEGVQAALGWLFVEMKRRYRVMEGQGLENCPDAPIFAFFSEFTAFTASNIGVEDAAVIFMLANFAQKALAANIVLVLDTQNPVGQVFGDSVIKRQMKMRFCFKTADQYDTGAILPPGTALRPYQTLHRAGECYGFVDSYYRRVLVSYAPEAELRRLRDSAAPQMNQWPAFDASQLEGFDAPKERGRPTETFTAAQIAAALHVTRHPPIGDKREALRRAMARKTGTGMGSTRIKELLELARELDAELDAARYCDDEAAAAEK